MVLHVYKSPPTPAIQGVHMRESMGSFHKHAYLYISFLEQDSLNS